MVPNLAYTNKNFYISNQVRFRFMYLFDLKTISLYIRGFYYLVNVLTSIKSVIRTLEIIKLTFI